MKNLALLFIASILLLQVQQCFGAFPVKTKGVAATLSKEKQSVLSNIKPLSLKPPERIIDNDEGGTKGIIAMALAGGSLASIALGFAALGSFSGNSIPFFIAGLLLSIAAITFGASGLDERRKGWACAGMILGIIELGGLVLFGLLMLFVAFLLGGF